MLKIVDDWVDNSHDELISKYVKVTYDCFPYTIKIHKGITSKNLKMILLAGHDNNTPLVYVCRDLGKVFSFKHIDAPDMELKATAIALSLKFLEIC